MDQNVEAVDIGAAEAAEAADIGVHNVCMYVDVEVCIVALQAKVVVVPEHKPVVVVEAEAVHRSHYFQWVCRSYIAIEAIWVLNWIFFKRK